MQKWKDITKILLATLILSSCKTHPDAPKLKRNPKQYIYADEPDLWCRYKDKKKKTIECVDERKLRKYGLFPIDDVKMIQKYIVDLNNDCEKWRKRK